MNQDQRRKLSDMDYQLIRLGYAMSHTIRELSTEFGVSTKYVKRIVEHQVQPSTNIIEEVWIPSNVCSGCNRSFDMSGIASHYLTWTSGGLHDLWCNQFMPLPLGTTLAASLP